MTTHKKEKDKFNPGMDIPNDAKNNNTVGSQTHAVGKVRSNERC